MRGLCAQLRTTPARLGPGWAAHLPPPPPRRRPTGVGEAASPSCTPLATASVIHCGSSAAWQLFYAQQPGSEQQTGAAPCRPQPGPQRAGQAPPAGLAHCGALKDGRRLRQAAGRRLHAPAAAGQPGPCHLLPSTLLSIPQTTDVIPHSCLTENLALCGVAAALEATSRSWVSRMELQWRRLLTDRLHGSYFSDMVGAAGMGGGAWEGASQP